MGMIQGGDYKEITDDMHIFVCDCLSEGWLLYAPKDEDEIDVSLFSFHGGYCFTWWNRLRAIWRILTKGTPYADQTTFTSKTARQFGELLIQLADVVAKEKKP